MLCNYGVAYFINGESIQVGVTESEKAITAKDVGSETYQGHCSECHEKDG